MKKLLSIVAALALIVAMMAIPVNAELQENVNGNYNPATTGMALQMYGVVDTLGSVISTVGDVNRVGFICPSWSNDVGSLTVTLWKWDTDYYTTVAAAPLLGPDVIADFEDNSFVGFVLDTPLQAGVYYVEMSEPADDPVGVWTAQSAYPGQLVFQDGEYMPKLALRMQVDYVTPLEEGAVPYGTLPDLEKPPMKVGGTDNNPYEVYFDMTKEDLSYFEGTSTVEFSTNEDGTLHVTVPEGAFDSQYPLSFTSVFDIDIDTEIPCEQYPYMAIRLRVCDTSYAPGAGEAFYFTTSIGGATGGYSSEIVYDYTTTEWQTVVIDPTSNKTFVDNALAGDSWMGFRFDPVNITPTQELNFDIAWIAFFQNEDAAKNFDGDFAAYEASKPTPAPTNPPTATPEPTNTPEPSDPAETDKPEATEAPTTTEAPQATEKPAKKSGCGGFVGGISAVAAVAAAAVLVIKKKER